MKEWKHKSVLSAAIKELNRAKVNLVQVQRAYTIANQNCGCAFKKERLASGIGLREMARKLGISAPYLSDIENGRRNFPEFWNVKTGESTRKNNDHI